MTFINTALAFGAAAFVIPLVIHLLNRSRFRKVEWGAMHLLESVIKTNHRRFQLDQLLLLLVRCAIPALLAFCLARPLLTGSKPLAGDAPVSLVILLDNSYSMNVSTADGTRFERAVSESIELISAAPQGSDFYVVLTGGQPTPLFDQPLFDADMVVRRLKEIKADFGASELMGSLDLAMETLAKMSHPRRELVVVSDLQESDWNPIPEENLEQIAERVKQKSIPISFSLLPIVTPAKKNIAVEHIELPQQAVGIGEIVPIRVKVRNFANTQLDNIKVSLKIDDKDASVSQITLRANSSSDTLFPIRFRNSGSHIIEASVSTEDDLAFDNQRFAVIDILEELKVLLVNGDPDQQPLKNETEFLEVALTPFTSSSASSSGGKKITDLVNAQSVTTRELVRDSVLGARVVVLANVRKLDDEPLQWIKEFVQAGGALIVFPGNKIDIDWYREKLYEEGKGLIPAFFGDLKGKLGRRGTVEQNKESAVHIVAQHYDHPALEHFNERAHGDLSTADIFRWYQLTSGSPASDSSNVPKQHVVASLDNGDPFILEKASGKGVAFLVATTCDTDWTNLPLQEFYLPLVQQLVTRSASRLSPPRNLKDGEPAIVMLDQQIDPVSLSVQLADETRRTVTSRKEGELHFARLGNTQRPGVYSIYKPDQTVHFAVSTSINESQLQSLSEESQTDLSNSLNAHLYDSAASYIKDDHSRRYGHEIWRYLLAALLIFMFLELVLQQRFSRVRT